MPLYKINFYDVDCHNSVNKRRNRENPTLVYARSDRKAKEKACEIRAKMPNGRRTGFEISDVIEESFR